jgi:hypothetical protein
MMYTVYGILYTVYSMYTVYCTQDTVLYIVNGMVYCTRYTVYILLYKYDSIPLVPVPHRAPKLRRKKHQKYQLSSKIAYT